MGQGMVWLGGHLALGVWFVKCRPSPVPPGSAWLEGSVGLDLNLHVPPGLGIPFREVRHGGGHWRGSS